MDENGSKNKGWTSYTRLYLVKHVLKILQASLNESDYLTLITFTDESEVILEDKQINKENKSIAFNRVKILKPLNGTYISPALDLAYELIKKITLW